MKWQRIISIATLAISVFTLYLVVRKPAPVAAPMPPAVAAASAQSFQEKINQLYQTHEPGASGVSSAAPAEVRINSNELSSALAQASGMIPAMASSPPASSGGDSQSANGVPMELPGPVPNIKDYQVSMDGDTLHGQFLTQIAGKDVYVTLAGHLGSKDGYATFEATEFKVGDLSVPVSLVNDALQKKLAEQHGQMKLPDGVKDLKVENGEMVFTEK